MTQMQTKNFMVETFTTLNVNFVVSTHLQHEASTLVDEGVNAYV